MWLIQVALSDEEVGRVGLCCHFANDLLCGENRRPVPGVMGGSMESSIVMAICQFYEALRW